MIIKWEILESENSLFLCIVQYMDEMELIEKAKAYDNEAFEELINLYRRMIYSIINKKDTKYSSYNLSKDDLYQEACISLYEACKRFDPERNVKFSSFAYRVISCRLNKVISKTTAIQKNELYIIDNINEKNRPFVVSDTVFTYEAQYARQIFFESLGDLSGEDKTILKMRLNNYSYKEIADMLNITTKRVDNRLCKLRNKLKKQRK